MLDDPTLLSGVAVALEKAINSALCYDPGTRSKLNELEGCSLKIHCLAPEFSLLFYLRRDHIEVGTYSEAVADIEISGKLVDFLQAIENGKHSYAESRLTISGKISRLNDLKTIFSQLDIDWEEPLTELFGTLSGHALAEGLRGSWQWANQQKSQFEKLLSPYLSEELRILPARTELNAFYNKVDEFRSRVERSAARIARLEKALTPSNPNCN